MFDNHDYDDDTDNDTNDATDDDTDDDDGDDAHDGGRGNLYIIQVPGCFLVFPKVVRLFICFFYSVLDGTPSFPRWCQHSHPPTTS